MTDRADVEDPTAPMDANLSRRAFVAMSAGAAAVTTIHAAAAADVPLGRFHPPLVPEDDPALIVERPRLDRPDGAIDAYAARPCDAGPSTPGVVVVQHVWGVDAQIRDVVRRFAKAGYVTIAPDLYGRLKPPNGDAATDFTLFSPLAQKLV